MRELHLAFGAGAPAVATVLAVFMLGLAIGAAALGRFTSRADRNPWLVYGALELLVAGFAALFPFALGALEPLLRAAYGTPGFWPLLVACATVLLLPPTACLGGTLPVMARALEREPQRFPRSLTRLYAANTAGAALGASLATFALLPRWGLHATELWLPVLNVIVGLVALAIGRRSGAAMAEPLATDTGSRRPIARTEVEARPLGRGAMLALAATSGFVLLLLEVATTRFLAIYLGQSVYGFGVMLTCFILALALGAWLAGRVAGRRTIPTSTFGTIALAAAVAIGVMQVVLERLPWWLASGQLAIHETATPFALTVGYQFLLGLAALLPAVVALGLIFPMLLASSVRLDPNVSNSVGMLYGVNTAGSVAGALLGGLLVVPALGPHGAVAVAAVATFACGLLVVFAGLRTNPTHRSVAVRQATLAAAATALLLIVGRPDPQVIARSPWLYSRTPDEYRDYRNDLDRKARSIEFVTHDAHGAVAVGSYLPAQPPYRFFSVNGKIDGGASRDDMLTQVGLGTWPCLLFDGGRRDPRHALVIGLGTGVTAGAALTFPLASLDVVEISPTMPRVARRFFAEVNRGALDDPRTRVIIGDGRHHLGYTRKTYDVIISEPSNPWISGIGFLFTRESFQHMRAALNDGGVACQWLQIYDLTPEAIASVIRTFASVFPNTIVLKTQDEPSDLLLLGLKSETVVDGPLLDVADLEQAFARHRVAPEYAPYSPTMLDDLLGRFVVGPAAIADLVGHAPLNTDDGAYIEFEAPKQLATEGDMTPVALQLGAHWEPATRYLRILRDRGPAIDDRSKSLALHARLGLRANVNVFELVARPEQGNRQLPLATAQAIEDELNAFGDRFGPCSLLYHLAGMLAEMRALPGAQSPALERYGPGFDPAIGRQFLEQAAALDPSNIGAQLDLATNCEYGSGGIRFGPGSELRRAADLYRSILARTPDMPGVRERLAEVTRARSHS